MRGYVQCEGTIITIVYSWYETEITPMNDTGVVLGYNKKHQYPLYVVSMIIE